MLCCPLERGGGLLLTAAIHKKSMLNGNHVMSPNTYIYIIYMCVSTGGRAECGTRKGVKPLTGVDGPNGWMDGAKGGRDRLDGGGAVDE